jgi:hypothetical protein
VISSHDKHQSSYEAIETPYETEAGFIAALRGMCGNAYVGARGCFVRPVLRPARCRTANEHPNEHDEHLASDYNISVTLTKPESGLGCHGYWLATKYTYA